MNTDSKCSKKTCKENTNTSKKIIWHDQVGLSTDKGLFNIHKPINVMNHVNSLKTKKSQEHPNRYRKGLEQNPTCTHDRRARERRTYTSYKIHVWGNH